MASTSRSNGTRNISSNVTLYEPQKHFTPTPHMTRMKFLQLHKLSDLSTCVSKKLHLSKIFLPNANDILTNELSQYAKDKLLEIIPSICHINENIETIGKDEELVKLIFCSLENCTRNVRLQKTLFKLFSLILCEIQCNNESIWIRHLVHFYKYCFGSNILRILRESNSDTELIITQMTFLDTLSDLKMPDGTNEYVLEHVFKIDYLVSALLKWFDTVFMSDFKFLTEINYFWVFVDKWIKIMTVVTKLHFKSRPHNSDNKADCVDIQIIYCVSFIYNMFRHFYIDKNVFEWPVLHDNSLSVILPSCLGAMYHSTRLLSNLPSCNLFLGSTETVLYILYVIPFSVSETGENDQAVQEHLDPCEVGRQFQVISSLAQKLHDVIDTREWSFKDILEILFLWKHLYPFLSSISLLYCTFLFNVPKKVQQKLDQLLMYEIELSYLLYRRRN